jgi:hypothetical protein
MAGFLVPDPVGKPLDLSAVTGMTDPVLLVVDYAETRTDQVTRLASTVWDAPEAPPIRLLLLARSAGDWWDELRRRHHVALSSASISTLPTLDDSLSSRREAFAHAVASFARALPAVDAITDWRAIAANVRPPSDLDADRYGTPLTLQMSALLSLLQSGPNRVPSQPGSPLPALELQLLDHEQRYWEQTAGVQKIALHSATLGYAVAAATLLGAATETEAVMTLSRVPGVRDLGEDSRLAVAHWLRDLYPHPSARYWGVLQPDRVAEHHVGAVTRKNPGLLDLLLVEASDEQNGQALTVLARATSHQVHLGVQLRGLLESRKTVLEPVAVMVAMAARDPLLDVGQGFGKIFANVSIEDRKVIWNQWLASPGAIL